METWLQEKRWIHDDYQFLMHSSGNKLGKQDILKWLMKDVKKEKVRVLFENDEVGFEHVIKIKEAVMTYYKYRSCLYLPCNNYQNKRKEIK